MLSDLDTDPPCTQSLRRTQVRRLSDIPTSNSHVTFARRTGLALCSHYEGRDIFLKDSEAHLNSTSPIPASNATSTRIGSGWMSRSPRGVILTHLRGETRARRYQSGRSDKEFAEPPGHPPLRPGGNSSPAHIRAGWSLRLRIDHVPGFRKIAILVGLDSDFHREHSSCHIIHWT